MACSGIRSCFLRSRSCLGSTPAVLWLFLWLLLPCHWWPRLSCALAPLEPAEISVFSPVFTSAAPLPQQLHCGHRLNRPRLHSCLQAPCPNCGTVNTTYFGDILTVAGNRDKNTLTCPCCESKLEFDAQRREVSGRPAAPVLPHSVVSRSVLVCLGSVSLEFIL